MDKATHTPGPWVILDDGTPEPLKIAQAGTFGSVAGLRGLAPDAEQFANARLIAAAPDLLAVVQEMFSLDHTLIRDIYGSEFVFAARAAIARATGTK